jgi:hypothetical protein
MSGYINVAVYWFAFIGVVCTAAAVVFMFTLFTYVLSAAVGLFIVLKGYQGIKRLQSKFNK